MHTDASAITIWHRMQRMSTPAQERYFTVAEAARLFQVSPSTVWRWIDERRLPAYRVGRRSIRIRQEDLAMIVQPAKETFPLSEREYAHPPVEQRDIWADYDPQRVRAALAASAGALRGVDIEQLQDDLADAREQDSSGRPA
jgi:excisionase family DNA binding protein